MFIILAFSVLAAVSSMPNQFGRDSNEFAGSGFRQNQDKNNVKKILHSAVSEEPPIDPSVIKFLLDNYASGPSFNDLSDEKDSSNDLFNFADSDGADNSLSNSQTSSQEKLNSTYSPIKLHFIKIFEMPPESSESSNSEDQATEKSSIELPQQSLKPSVNSMTDKYSQERGPLDWIPDFRSNNKFLSSQEASSKNKEDFSQQSLKPNVNSMTDKYSQVKVPFDWFPDFRSNNKFLSSQEDSNKNKEDYPQQTLKPSVDSMTDKNSQEKGPFDWFPDFSSNGQFLSSQEDSSKNKKEPLAHTMEAPKIESVSNVAKDSSQDQDSANHKNEDDNSNDAKESIPASQEQEQKPNQENNDDFYNPLATNEEATTKLPLIGSSSEITSSSTPLSNDNSLESDEKPYPSEFQLQSNPPIIEYYNKDEGFPQGQDIFEQDIPEENIQQFPIIDKEIGSQDGYNNYVPTYQEPIQVIPEYNQQEQRPYIYKRPKPSFFSGLFSHLPSFPVSSIFFPSFLNWPFKYQSSPRFFNPGYFEE